ncbi:MAG TPA: response regulator transcription factor, partial [Thermodesulfobacteriota bacterium]
MKKTRIFIADDHPVLRSGIKAIFRPEEFEVVGEADNGVSALKGIASLKPDIAILDITMPGLDGIAATRRIADEFPDTKVIILSMHSDISRPI